MLGVDVGHFAAPLLSLGYNVQCKSRLTGRLRAIDLDDTSSRNAADPQRQIQRKRTGGDGVHHRLCILTQPHDGALAKVAFDLRHGSLQSFFLVAGRCSRLQRGLFRCHIVSSFPQPFPDGCDPYMMLLY